MVRYFILNLFKLILYGVFSIIDFSVWILIHILPGILLITLINSRPWLRYKLFIKPNDRKVWSCRFTWLLKTRSNRARICSSCLSRSLTGRILLDLIGVPNELHFGMSKFKNGRKVPHAWLCDAASGKLLTPGIIHDKGVEFTSL